MQKNQTFGAAIEAIKAGKRASREGWREFEIKTRGDREDGEGMFIFLLEGGEFDKGELPEEIIDTEFDGTDEDSTFNASPSIGMWTHDSTGRKELLKGWLPSQTDMFAEDWCIFE